MATVDILLATYNGESYVQEQIKSIQQQTFSDWRLLVSDDCSTDGTLKSVKKIAGNDSRILIVSESIRYGSAKANFINLLSYADAPYIMFCDQDDIWLPEKIETSLSAVQEVEKRCSKDVPILAFCDMKVVDKDLRVLHDSFEKSSNFNPKRLALKYLLAMNIAAGCCMLFNQALRKMVLKTKDTNDVEMHDWWTILVASAFGTIVYVDKTLSLYRQHENNEVGANKFSPIQRARNLSFMLSEFLSSIKQACLFDTVYGEELSLNDRQCIVNYTAIIKSSSFWSGLKHLFMSGCWKQGLRKLGQIVMVRLVTIDKQ